MSHPSNPAADSAREAARQDNGQFGTQPRAEAGDIELTAHADYESSQNSGGAPVAFSVAISWCPVYAVLVARSMTMDWVTRGTGTTW